MKIWTAEQQEIIYTDDYTSHLAVAADAGAGKTSVLVERVRHLITKLTLNKRILCISFTRKSAADLEERLSEFNVVDVHTIHGFCARLISEFGNLINLSPVLRIVDMTESKEVFLKCFEKVYRRYPIESDEHSVKIFYELCAQVQNLPYQKLNLFGLAEQKQIQDFVKNVLEEYRFQKLKRDVVEYNDLEQLAVDLLEIQTVRTRIQKRFRYIFVDEFQDTSQIQCELISLLLKDSLSTLFVVGDEKQSIYRFRGADVNVYSNFVSQLKNKKRLSSNFRSHPDIIEAVNRVCSPILPGYEPMSAARKNLDFFPDSLQRVARVITNSESEGILRLLSLLNKEGVALNQTVLLFRQMRGKESLFFELKKNGISISTSSSFLSLDKSFIKLLNLWIWAVRPFEALSQAQVAIDFGFSDRAGLQKLVMPRSSYYGSEILNSAELLYILNNQFQLKEKFGLSYEQFTTFILAQHEKGVLPPKIALHFKRILNGEDLCFGTTPPPANLSDSLRALTVHSAKGLEFPVVILADVEARPRPRGALLKHGENLWCLPRKPDGTLDKSDPLYKAALDHETQQELFESARLLYVAMTRAQEALYVIESTPEPRSWGLWLKAGIENEWDFRG